MHLHQNLKIPNLSRSYWLTKSPDFSKLPNLEELILEFCVSLSEVSLIHRRSWKTLFGKS
ncbi:hypothetical protein Prudu_004732 [Prunus dulcis]|uniref:Uncharacterized protein n=1 Tax=Prunus dulcis TaxID=3755 RepID=A0A4Y1QW30_PRUDU|nr:hypothetical protein Prudu_004732 [Prunus dulcis]